MKHPLLVRTLRYCGVKQSETITKRESEYNADGDKLSLVLTESRYFPFSQSGDPVNSKVLCMPWACSSVFVAAWLKKNWFGPVPGALLARDRLGKKWQWASFSSSVSHANSPVMGNSEIPLYSCIYSFTGKHSSFSCFFFLFFFLLRDLSGEAIGLTAFLLNHLVQKCLQSFA